MLTRSQIFETTRSLSRMRSDAMFSHQFPFEITIGGHLKQCLQCNLISIPKVFYNCYNCLAARDLIYVRHDRLMTRLMTDSRNVTISKQSRTQTASVLRMCETNVYICIYKQIWWYLFQDCKLSSLMSLLVGLAVRDTDDIMKRSKAEKTICKG